MEAEETEVTDLIQFLSFLIALNYVNIHTDLN